MTESQQVSQGVVGDPWLSNLMSHTAFRQSLACARIFYQSQGSPSHSLVTGDMLHPPIVRLTSSVSLAPTHTSTYCILAVTGLC
jgi:hypothetical protein